MMVVRRVVENLKNRPPEERESAAASLAIGIVLVLFLGWGALFITNLRESGFGYVPPSSAENTAAAESSN